MTIEAPATARPCSFVIFPVTIFCWADAGGAITRIASNTKGRRRRRIGSTGFCGGRRTYPQQRHCQVGNFLPVTRPETEFAALIDGSRQRERLRTVVVPDHDDLAALLADRIVEVIRRETAAKGRCVLGLATGSKIGRASCRERGESTVGAGASHNG